MILNRFINHINNNNNNNDNNSNSNNKRLRYSPYVVNVFFQEGGFKSCEEIHQEFPQTESGYYWVNIGNREAQVYCDMKNYGEYFLSY